MPIFKFGEYLPDVPPLENPGTAYVLNVIPALESYRPAKGLTVVSTNALAARAQGAIALQDADGDVRFFSGDATALYELSALAFADVSRTSGGAYATGVEEWWEFAQFGTSLVATNFTDDIQTFNLASDTNFSALGGSPPKARHIAVVREFLVIGNIGATPSKVRWCGSNAFTTWTIGTQEADEQELPDGGAVQRIIGGEVGWVFQERAITRMTRVAAPVTFQLDKIADIGALTPQSVVKVGADVYFLSSDGFYKLSEGGGIQAIGKEKVDKTFLDDLDSNYAYRVTASYDPKNKLVIWSYPSVSATNGTPDKVVAYDYVLNRWSPLAIEAEMFFPSLAPGTTLEDLDSISASLDALGVSLDSTAWAGGALALGAFDTSHKFCTAMGDNLAATLETSEGQIAPNKRVFVNLVRPIVDTTAATVQLSYRERVADSPSLTSAAVLESDGSCAPLASGRYFRARVAIPAATSWTHAQGVEFVGEPDGEV